MYILVLYLIIVNLISFGIMGFDKAQARKGKRRTPERTIWLWVWIGGSLGGFIGMELFRHKTKHNSFKLGLPALVILHALVLYWLGTR
ncbi:DUF1294 domain-containing protein [Radiobacillus kanasensis]|uniref:DUF1294 domain-containing protein n=1 Tax=Radiobacillus kanasensis TaxID=2844358 RepID=UPI001E3B67AF|nr:DUF1294 domain-containing protein [Radiobacillus kanasensis]UFT97990.1 DUF1294 domain-containing protein [Radiobacillus kanasensis]